MIRLVMPCPLCREYVAAEHACDCSTDNVGWYHLACGEPDYVDYAGNLHCGRDCPHNNRSIFGDVFICGSNKEKHGTFRAHAVM